MGRNLASVHPENLTVSRVHRVLRPLETKLNSLATILEKRVTEDKTTLKIRQPGITYAKRHRIRALTGMSARQAARAYALHQNQALSVLYGFTEHVIAVEDAFRNLVQSIPSCSTERVPSLSCHISKMIGRHIAEESLEDEDNCDKLQSDPVGSWYEALPITFRKEVIISHAVQLVIWKLPIFVLELWKGLLAICLKATLHHEASLFLEHILLYYFTSYTETDNPQTECPIHSKSASRELTSLYTTFSQSLSSGDFFSLLLPLLCDASPATWHCRAVNHLFRIVANDIMLTIRMLRCMVDRYNTTTSPSRDSLLTILWERGCASLRNSMNQTLEREEALELLAIAHTLSEISSPIKNQKFHEFLVALHLYLVAISSTHSLDISEIILYLSTLDITTTSPSILVALAQETETKSTLLEQCSTILLENKLSQLERSLCHENSWQLTTSATLLPRPVLKRRLSSHSSDSAKPRKKRKTKAVDAIADQIDSSSDESSVTSWISGQEEGSSSEEYEDTSDSQTATEVSSPSSSGSRHTLRKASINTVKTKARPSSKPVVSHTMLHKLQGQTPSSDDDLDLFALPSSP